VAVKIRISNDFSAYGNGNTFGLKQKTQFFQNNFCFGARYYGVNNRPIGENLPNRCKRAQFGHPDLTDLFPVSDSSRRRVVLAEERLGQALVCHVVLLTIFAGAGFVLKYKISKIVFCVANLGNFEHFWPKKHCFYNYICNVFIFGMTTINLSKDFEKKFTKSEHFLKLPPYTLVCIDLTTNSKADTLLLDHAARATKS
jgi:hypothetical protein